MPDTAGLPDTSGLQVLTSPELPPLPAEPPAVPARPVAPAAPDAAPDPVAALPVAAAGAGALLADPPVLDDPPAARWPVIPAPPSVPPTVPAPTVPAPTDGVPTGGFPVEGAPVAPPPVPAPAPVIEPMFTRAPGLNWAGPGDRWSQAWAVRTLADDRPAAPGPAPEPAPDLRAAAELAPTARDVALVRETLAVVEPVADRATAHFYALIFLHHPEVRALFPAAMDVQRDRLFRALLTAASSAGDPDGLRAHLAALGRGHRRYGTLTGHYAPVGECLVAALARYAGARWDTETELAWRRVYRLVSSIMIEAAEGAARTSPAWWQAEVVAHELRTPDVAVLTLRPDQPYPYRAGQYTSLETPWWPRVWRHYSLATAPRPDGLLTLHVKAVQAGWVSNALVHRAAAGDVLRLGPAAGTMTVDHAGGADLLCVGGGTGIAPVRALVEEVAEYGAAGRSVEVFHGARCSAELYGLAELHGLARRHPWLSVRGVLSAEPAGDGLLGGELPEVLGRLGPWQGRDAFLAGPPAMVRRSVGVLLRAGVAPERIRHDLAGEPAAG